MERTYDGSSEYIRRFVILARKPSYILFGQKMEKYKQLFFLYFTHSPIPAKKNLVNLNFAEMSKLLKSGLPTKGYSLNNPAKLNFSSFLEFAKFGHL